MADIYTAVPSNEFEMPGGVAVERRWWQRRRPPTSGITTLASLGAATRRNRPEIRSGRAGVLGTNSSEDVHVRAQASRARKEAAIARAVMPPAA